jgi:hypothetical protein
MRHPHYLSRRGGLYSGLTSAANAAQADYAKGISHGQGRRRRYGGSKESLVAMRGALYPGALAQDVRATARAHNYLPFFEQFDDIFPMADNGKPLTRDVAENIKRRVLMLAQTELANQQITQAEFNELFPPALGQPLAAAPQQYQNLGQFVAQHNQAQPVAGQQAQAMWNAPPPPGPPAQGGPGQAPGGGPPKPNGKGRRRRGGIGLEAGLTIGKTVAHLIPGGDKFLQDLGLEEAPPPPPPTASFHAMSGFEAPTQAARKHVKGRGKNSPSNYKMKVQHSCPHCGCGKQSAPHVSKHKCRMCGGGWFSDAVSAVKKVAANPYVQKAVSMAAPHVQAYAQKHAPGLVSAVQKYAPMAQAAYAHPLGQMAAKHLGMGRRRRGKGWFSDAVSAVKNVAANPLVQQAYKMAAPHVQAYAQKHAPGLSSALSRAKSAYQSPLGQMAAKQLGFGKRRTRPPTAHSLAVGQVMKGTGMGLGAASRYVKENGLAYQ